MITSKTDQSQIRAKIRRYKSINLGEVSAPFLFESARGSYVYDSQGQAKLDFTSGYGVANTGWMHPKLVAAVQQQLEKATYAPPWFATELALELSEILLKKVPLNMSACLRSTGGAEAMEGVLRAVFALTGKSTLVSFERSYHGGTAKAIRLSDYEAFHLMEMPKSAHHYLKVPFPNEQRVAESLNKLEAIFQTTPDIAAFIAEPVIGSGGVLVPPDGFLKRLQDLCRKYKVLFVVDEVITGFGRTGSFSACESEGLSPDAILFAKGMGSGYIPIGCGILNKELSDALRQYEDVTPTFAWTPLACAAAIANIQVIEEEGLCEKAKVDGDYLLKATKDLLYTYLPNHTKEVRGKGLMIGIELQNPGNPKPTQRFTQKLLLGLFHEGLMCCADWDSHTIILMPPLTIAQRELDEGLNQMEKILKKYSKNL